MKIVHVVEPFAAGVAVFIRSLTETMPEELHIVVHGERKLVMSAKEVKQTFPKENVRFIRWKSAQRSINPLKDILALGELHKILRRLKRKNLVDAVHLHSSKSGILGRIACRMAGIKNVIYTPNGAPFLADKNFLSKYLYKKLEKLGNGIGGTVVCCSESELTEYQKLGIDASFINNGISVASVASAELRKNQNSKFTIITTGRIEAQKDPELFNTIASYFAEFDQIAFVWAGDGAGRAALQAPNITVTGWPPQQEVTQLVAQANVFLSTSAYEGLSFAVLEALALKKPVLLHDCVGNADVIKNGLNGDIFKGAEEAIYNILNYYNNQEMMDVMGAYGHEICTNEFNMHQNFNNYKNMYKNRSEATVSHI